MGKPELLEPRRQLAADLAEIRRFAGPNPDVDYMAGLLLENFHAGRYGAAAPAAPGVPERPACSCPTFNALARGSIAACAVHGRSPAPTPPSEPRGDE